MVTLIDFIDSFVGSCPAGLEPIRYMFALAFGFVIICSLIWAISAAQQLLYKTK